MSNLVLLQGDFGPFLPQIATHVPLWLAVALKKRGKCTIRLPEWMSVGEFICQIISFSKPLQIVLGLLNLLYTSRSVVKGLYILCLMAPYFTFIMQDLKEAIYTSMRLHSETSSFRQVKVLNFQSSRKQKKKHVCSSVCR